MIKKPEGSFAGVRADSVRSAGKPCVVIETDSEADLHPIDSAHESCHVIFIDT